MPYPSPLELTYSYTGFQQSQGNNSFPGTQLDADLQEVKAALDVQIEFLQGAFTSEGSLKEEAVPDLAEMVDEAEAARDAAEAHVATAAGHVTTAAGHVASAATHVTTAAGHVATAAAHATAAETAETNAETAQAAAEAAQAAAEAAAALDFASEEEIEAATEPLKAISALTAPLATKFHTGFVSAKHLGVTPDASADRTAVWQALLDRTDIDETIIVPKGDYLIDEVSWAEKHHIIFAPDAILKRRSTAAGASDLLTFDDGADGSVVEGLHVDGRRTTHHAGYDDGGAPIWTEVYVRTHDITLVRPRVKNGLYTGFNSFIDNETPVERLRIVGPMVLEDCSNNALTNQQDLWVDDILIYRPDNQTMPIAIRALGLNTIVSGRIGRLFCTGMTGDANQPLSSGVATAFLGFDWDDLEIGSIRVHDSEGVLKHLCGSFVRCGRTRIGFLEALRYHGTGYEITDPESMSVAGGFCDGYYHVGGGSSIGTTIGFVVHGSSSYPLGERHHWALKAKSERASFYNLRAQRVGFGIINRIADADFHGAVAIGCRTRGIYQDIAGETSSFDEIPDSSPRRVRWIDSLATFNEGHGLLIRAGSATISGGEFSNNGQVGGATSANRAGIGQTAGSTDTIDEVILQGQPIARDTQTGVFVDGLTWQPGAAAQTWPHNTGLYVKKLSVLEPAKDRLSIGQTLEIQTAGGAGVHHTVKVLDILHDEIWVDCLGSALNFVATSNLAALTGTCSTGGVASTTITGSGTAFLSELNGPFWITDGTEYTQVEVSETSDTTLTVSEPITMAAGTAMFKLAADVHEIPSQQRACYFANANVEKVINGGLIAEGNTVSNDVDLHADTTRQGMRSFRADKQLAFKELTVADDAVATFALPTLFGVIEIISTTAETGSAAFRATSPSALINSHAETGSGGHFEFAIATLTAGASDGTDGNTNVSVDTSGNCTIKNRRGASRTYFIYVRGN